MAAHRDRSPPTACVPPPVSLRFSLCAARSGSFCACLEHLDAFLLSITREAVSGVPPRLVVIDELMPPAQTRGVDADWKEAWAKSQRSTTLSQRTHGGSSWATGTDLSILRRSPLVSACVLCRASG